MGVAVVVGKGQQGRLVELRALRRVGVPYSDAEIAKAGDAVKGKTEIDALVAYLQVLGITLK